MLWWGWLIIGALAALVIVFVVLLIMKNRPVAGLTQEEKDELIRIEKERIAKDLSVDSEKEEKIKELVSKQNEKIKKLEELYKESKESIDNERCADFDKYLNDTNTAGAELDKLLGISSGGSEEAGDKTG